MQVAFPGAFMRCDGWTRSSILLSAPPGAKTITRVGDNDWGCLMSSKRVLLVAARVDTSGIGSTILTLTPGHRHLVDALLWLEPGDRFESLDPDVGTYVLGARSNRSISAAAKLRSVSRNYDLVHFLYRPLATAVVRPHAPVVQSLNVLPRTSRARVHAQLTYRAADGLIALSPQGAEVARKIAPGVPCATIPHGTPLPDAVRISRSDPPTIAMVSRLSPGKGIELLPGVAAEIKRRALPVRIDVWGDGILRDELQSAVDSHGSVLRWRGSARSGYDALREADALLFLSEHETLGLPPIEAMAMGLPTISAPLPAATSWVMGDAPRYEARRRKADDVVDQVEYWLKSSANSELAARLHTEYLTRLSEEIQVRPLEEFWSKIADNY